MNSEQKSSIHFRLFPGFWIVLGVLALVITRVAWGWCHSPHNLELVARDFSWIDIFQKRPVANHEGTLLGMIHTTPRGVGVFIANVTNKTEVTICEDKDKDYLPDAANVFGWSPDDARFAYSWDLGLHFVDNNGEEIPNAIPTNDFQSFVWLSPDRGVHRDLTPKLTVVQRTRNSWYETASWPLWATAAANLGVMVAVGSNAVAWHTDHSMWQMNLSTGETKSLYDANPRCTVASISYSAAIRIAEVAHYSNVEKGVGVSIPLIGPFTGQKSVNSEDRCRDYGRNTNFLGLTLLLTLL